MHPSRIAVIGMGRSGTSQADENADAKRSQLSLGIYGKYECPGARSISGALLQ